MNAPRRIRTVVVTLPVDSSELATGRLARSKTATRARFRPSDLLPWSDPYIAGLVRKLQNEVREDQAGKNLRIASEAEMPWNEPFEYEYEDHSGFSIDPDALLR